MCGRFEGMFLYGTTVLAVVLFSFQHVGVHAQELPSGLIDLLEEKAEVSGYALEELADYYYQMSAEPLDINTADADKLRQLAVLSEFQIQSILDYRKEHGQIISFLELSLIDGFSESFVDMIRPLIYIGDDAATHSGYKPKPKYELLLKARKSLSEASRKSVYMPSAIKFNCGLKYRMVSGKGMDVGFSLENDDGEVIYPDHVSAYIHFRNRKIFGQRSGIRLEALVLGDYKVRLGQGLTVWNSGSFFSMTTPSASLRMASGITPYASSDELRFFRGIASSFSWKDRLRWGLFLSSRKKDARTDGEYFYSLPETGLHNTESALLSRHTLSERLAGLYCSYYGESFKVGINAVMYGYDMKDARPLRDYNRYQRFNGIWANFSADVVYSFQGRRFFGELAVDKGGGVAFLAGGILPLGNALELSFLSRYYMKDYIAPFAGGYAVNSTVSNEHGILAGVRWNFGRSWNLKYALDAAYNPAPRYRIPAGSVCLKTISELERSFPDNGRLYFRLTCRWSLHDKTTAANFKADFRSSPESGESGWAYSARLEMTGTGSETGLTGSIALYQECGYVYRFLSAFFRITAFHADDWENRIYCYERDLPYSFSVPALYGRGLGVYLLLKSNVTAYLDIGAKVSHLFYPSGRHRNSSVFKIQVRLKL